MSRVAMAVASAGSTAIPGGAAPPAWRILVVDDNDDAASTLALLLALSGHQTRTAHDGPQALQVAAEFHPQAVLLDIGLPGISGHEVARRLRAEPGGADLVLLALTGWGQPLDRLASSEAGFDAHLVKPVDHDQLMQLLADLLGRLR